MNRTRRLRARLGSVSSAYAVLERDFLVFTSQKRFLVTRTLAVLIPAIVIAVIVANQVGQASEGLGQYIFGGGAVTVPLLVLLLAPALAASSISAERNLRTLDIVLAAPVGPWSFVLAKFLSRLGTVLVLVFATLPICALCLVYGGISLGLVLDALALAVGFAVWGVALGVFSSAVCRGVGPAVLLAYALTILLPLVYLWVLGLLDFLGAPQRNLALLAFSNFACWGAVLASSWTGMATGPGVAHLLAAWVVAVPALGLAGLRIRNEAAWTYRGPRTSRRRLRIATGLPVLDRSLRGSLLSQPGWGAIGALVCVVIVEALSIWAGLDGSDIDEAWPHLLGMELSAGIICFAVLARSASGIAGERKQGSLALLLATPLGTGRIVAAKLGATILSVAPLMALPLAHGLLAAPASELNHAAVLTWLFCTGIIVFLFAAIGIRISIAARSAGTAVLAVFGLLVLWLIGHGVLMFLLAMLDVHQDVAMFAAGASPPVPLVSLPIFAVEGGNVGSDRVFFGACVFWLIVYGLTATLLLARADAALEKRRE